MKRINLLTLAVFSIVAASSARGAVTITSATGATTVDVTTEGSLDWVVWNSTNAPFPGTFTTESKVGGTEIGTVGQVGGPFTTESQALSHALSWTDGDPTLAGSANRSWRTDAVAGFNSGNGTLGHGFTIDVGASDIERTLRFYVSLFNAEGTLTATLGSDTQTATLDAGSGSTTLIGVFEITFSDPVDTSLTIDWVETADKGNYDSVHIAGATLTQVPEPSSLALLGVGGLLIACRRRR